MGNANDGFLTQSFLKRQVRKNVFGKIQDSRIIKLNLGGGRGAVVYKWDLYVEAATSTRL